MIKIFLPDYAALVSVDLCDLATFSAHEWRVRTLGNTRYVTRRDENGRDLFLHRDIMIPPEEMVIDHIDGDGLNNTRGNLRVLTHQQNLWNRPRHDGSIGVSKRDGAWRAYINLDGEKLDLGSYGSEQEAMMVRDMVSMKLRGLIGTLNNSQADFNGFDLLKIPPLARRIVLAA